MAYKIDFVYYPASKKETEAKNVQNSLTECSVKKKAKIVLSDVYKGKPHIGPGGRVIMQVDRLSIVKDLLDIVTKIDPKNFGGCNINIQAQ